MKLKTKKITRKEAMKKVGFSALAAATMTILETKMAAAGSPEVSPTAPGTSRQLR